MQVNALLVSGLSIGVVTNIEFGLGTVGRAQFEEALPGVGPTRFERRHGETALCQRYFQFMPIGSGVWQNTNARFNYAATFPIVMRAIPTVTLLASGTGITVPFVANYAVSSIFYAQASTNSCFVGLNTATSTVGAIGIAQPDLLISLSAEI